MSELLIVCTPLNSYLDVFYFRLKFSYMKQYSIFIILILFAVTLIFAFQNMEPASIRFLVWSLSGSQSLIIIITFISGLITGMLFLASRLYSKNRELKNFRKEFLEKGKVEK